MLRFLPLVVLVVLLASWGCQVFTKIIRALRTHEVHDESVATSEFCFKAMSDKDPNFLVTQKILTDS